MLMDRNHSFLDPCVHQKSVLPYPIPRVQWLETEPSGQKHHRRILKIKQKIRWIQCIGHMIRVQNCGQLLLIHWLSNGFLWNFRIISENQITFPVFFKFQPPKCLSNSTGLPCNRRQADPRRVLSPSLAPRPALLARLHVWGSQGHRSCNKRPAPKQPQAHQAVTSLSIKLMLYITINACRCYLQNASFQTLLHDKQIVQLLMNHIE